MINVIVNILLSLNNLLGGQLGITLIVIGVASRVIFYPLYKKQLTHTKRIQELQPKINLLKKKFKDDKVKLAEAQTKLFQEEGINPAAGCLPLIVQIVIFATLYNAIRQMLTRGIDTSFLWMDLALPDTFKLASVPFALPGFFILAASLSQFILSKMMLPTPVPVNPEDKPKEVEQKADFMQDMAEAQKSMIYIFPLMFIVLGYNFPAGLSIYWTATTATAIYQQFKISGPGGLTPWISKLGIRTQK